MQEKRLKFPIEVVHQCGDYYKSGHSIKETAKKFNVKYEWVKQNLLRYGYRQPSKKLPNQLCSKITYFSNIDSNNKAYILGWLFSDGYICKNPYGYTMGIALKTEDKYILEFIAKELNLPLSKIKKYKNSYKLSINEKQLCFDLMNLGICENKSHTEIHIPNISKQYYNSFIAGVFDGDGCITNKKSGYTVISICSNSKTFLEEISQILNDNDILTRPVRKEKQNLYILYISAKNNSRIKFADYIYGYKEIKLLRKYNKFMKIPR